MATLTWDSVDKRYYEMGVSNVVLFPYDNTINSYGKGVAWNGVTNITDSSEGADANDLYGDNIKYASLRSAEKINGSIETYTYPNEWLPCIGTVTPVPGILLKQQNYSRFGLCWKTLIFNGSGNEVAYRLHFIYGALASPSDSSYDTINASPDARTYSWNYTTTPIRLDGYKPLAKVEVDSRFANNVEPTALEALERIIYGTRFVDSRLPLPSELSSIVERGEIPDIHADLEDDLGSVVIEKVGNASDKPYGPMTTINLSSPDAYFLIVNETDEQDMVSEDSNLEIEIDDEDPYIVIVRKSIVNLQ